MTHRTPRVQLAGTALLLAALVPFVGCSDDDGAGASTSAATASAETTTRSTVPTTTSSPSRTTAAATTTEAPPTTVDPIAATKAAVAAAVAQARQDYLYATMNYDAPDALTVFGQTTAPDSPSYQLGIANINELQSHGWRVRLNPDVPSVTTVEGDVTLLDGPPATKAEVTVCTIDSPVVYEPGGAPDGSDTVVNDEITAFRTRVTVVMQDGVWKVYEGTGIGKWPGSTSCPAA
jgi:hypothetical protein